MPISKKSLQLAIKALVFYANAFYGWSAKLHEEDMNKLKEYQVAIDEFGKELESMKSHGKHSIPRPKTR